MYKSYLIGSDLLDEVRLGELLKYRHLSQLGKLFISSRVASLQSRSLTSVARHLVYNMR